MARLPNYVCSSCGRGFSTLRSAHRHVKNVESGNGQVIKESDYRIGLITGKIVPPLTQLLPRSKSRNKADIANEEVIRGFHRRLGEKICEEAYEGLDANWKDLLKKMLISTFIQEIMNPR